MSWSISIKGTPESVIEQLVNMPAPQGQNALGLAQFNGVRTTLIEQVKAIRDTGLPEPFDAIVISAGGHSYDSGLGNFGATISLTYVDAPLIAVPDASDEFIAEPVTSDAVVGGFIEDVVSSDDPKGDATSPADSTAA
jgi:hypothetical protein